MKSTEKADRGKCDFIQAGKGGERCEALCRWIPPGRDHFVEHGGDCLCEPHWQFIEKQKADTPTKPPLGPLPNRCDKCTSTTFARLMVEVREGYGTVIQWWCRPCVMWIPLEDRENETITGGVSGATGAVKDWISDADGWDPSTEITREPPK